jgi:hypothetical protein
MGVFRRMMQELTSEKGEPALADSDIPWLQALQ